MRPSPDRHDRRSTVQDRQTTVRLVSVPEAAEILGVTPDAVRSRLRRGKLRKERDEDGTVLVALEVEAIDGHDLQPDQSDRQPTALIEHMASEIEHLRDQLAAEREANRENRRLLAAALERIPPQLEAPSGTSEGPPDAPVTASEEPGKGETRGEDQGDAERRSWLYRFFFGT